MWMSSIGCIIGEVRFLVVVGVIVVGCGLVVLGEVVGSYN